MAAILRRPPPSPALLDNQEMSGTARAHLEAMLVNVDRMVEALAEITSSFGHDGGKSTALAILHSRQHTPGASQGDGLLRVGRLHHRYAWAEAA
jgi:hypothetical protein